MKALVNGEHLVLEREEFISVHSRKSLAIMKRHHLPFALTNVDIVDRFNGEVIAAEREDLWQSVNKSDMLSHEKRAFSFICSVV